MEKILTQNIRVNLFRTQNATAYKEEAVATNEHQWTPMK